MKPSDIKEIERLLKPVAELVEKVDNLRQEVATSVADHRARIKINEENIESLFDKVDGLRDNCEDKREKLGKRINRCGNRSDNRWFDILKSLLLVAVTASFSIFGTMQIVEKKAPPVILHPSDRRGDMHKEKKDGV